MFCVSRQAMIAAARVAAFAAAFIALQFGWQMARGSALDDFVIGTMTARPATWIINTLTPEVGAVAAGSSINSHGGGLNIRNGCEGTEALFLLMAAFVATPLGWSSRWKGFLLGTAVVYVANQLRVVGLFYAYRSNHALFDTMHSFVMPLALIVIVAGFFYAWLHRATKPLAPAA
jgi:exosortase/archaeosortase family protein